jgi:hypothetical protein
MSQSADFIASLALAQTNLYRYGGPILIGIGTVSCILALLVFTQKSLRKNPCSICFMAFSIANFLSIYLSQLLDVLQIGFDIGVVTNSISFCRIRFYLSFMLVCLAPSYLVMASIDRTLITSSNARTRKWSNRRTASIYIAAVTLFWMLFHIHAFIYTDLIQLGPNYAICYFQPGTYTVFVGYYALVVALIPFLLTTICGLLTTRNLRRLRRVKHAFVASNNNNIAAAHSRIVNEKERQLIIMCLVEIVTYVIFCFPEFIILFYEQITQYQVKSDEQGMIEQLVQSVASFSLRIPFSISSYTYLIVSKTFRAEIKGLVARVRALCFA